jgi:ribosomal protein L19E
MAKREQRCHKLRKWQNKIRNLRKYLRGWAKNASGTSKKEK